MNDRGQVVPLVAVLVLACGLGALWLGRLGGAAVSRAQAQTAADMAALAGVAGGRAEAASVAAANGARLVAYEARGDQAFVKVALRRAEATARARRTGVEGVDGAVGAVGGLVPELQAALAKAGELLGRPVPVTSGFRSTAQQVALYARRHLNPFPVAPPGTSQHERGRAVDVPRHFVPLLLSVAGRVGLCHPHADDPVHFELCR